MSIAHPLGLERSMASTRAQIEVVQRVRTRSGQHSTVAQLFSATRTLRTVHAGVIAGLASRLVTFPADTLKARLQVVGALESSLSNSSSAQQPAATSTPPARKITGEKRWGPPVATAARLLWRREGLPGFFRGFGAVAVGTAPGQAAYFGGYECGKMIVPERYGLLGDMGVGCIAQLFAGVAFTPIDIIKERLQVPPLLHCILCCGSAPAQLIPRD